MTHYAILDTNAGFLQWLGEAPSENGALTALAVEANEPELLDYADDSLRVYALTAQEADEVLNWWEHGALSSKCPSCLDSSR